MNKKTDPSCEFCKVLLNKKQDNTFICDGKVSSIFLNYNQNYKGRCLLILNEHYDAIDKMSSELQRYFWDDLMNLYQIILHVFNPSKINLALLGNKVSHVHWHLIPRYQNENNYFSPPWPSKDIRLDEETFSKIKKMIIATMEAKHGQKTKIYR